MRKSILIQIQRKVLSVVAGSYPQVYLVGGTAISLLCRHRMSEDLDFFTQQYTRALHREIVVHIRRKMGYSFSLIDEEMRKKYVNMAVYEFEVGEGRVLKIDFVSDFTPLIKPPGKDGIASMEDVYYRKIIAVIGWKTARSSTGGILVGGRQKTKDLFDIFYLSQKIEPLSRWFPKYFDRQAYERLTAWYLAVPKQRTIGELLELVPGCDTRTIFMELDHQIIHELNKVYFR